MILKNNNNSTLLVHLLETDEMVEVLSGENIKIEGKYKLYQSTTKKLNEIFKIKKNRDANK